MSYFPNIPQASDDPSVSQGLILQNFQTIGTDFSVNHVALGAVSNAGKHNFVEMVNQSSIPATTANEGSLYTEAVTRSGVTESQIFYTADGNTTEKYQISTILHAAQSLFGKNTNNYNSVGTAYTGGWTFLPGGLIFQYGLYYAGVGGLGSSGTIIFPVAFTVTPFCVSPVLICKSAGTSSIHTVSVIDTTVGTTSFKWNLDASTTAQTGIYWTAIGT